MFDQFDYFAVYSHSHTLDPSYGELKDKIREKYLRTGIDPELHPVFSTIWSPSLASWPPSATACKKKKTQIRR